jgi:hypothetical protein
VVKLGVGFGRIGTSSREGEAAVEKQRSVGAVLSLKGEMKERDEEGSAASPTTTTDRLTTR